MAHFVTSAMQRPRESISLHIYTHLHLPSILPILAEADSLGKDWLQQYTLKVFVITADPPKKKTACICCNIIIAPEQSPEGEKIIPKRQRKDTVVGTIN